MFKPIFLTLLLTVGTGLAPAGADDRERGDRDGRSEREGGQGSGGGNVTPDIEVNETEVLAELVNIKPLLKAAMYYYEDTGYTFEVRARAGQMYPSYIPYLTFFNQHRPGKTIYDYVDAMVLRINNSDCLHKGEKVDASIDHPNPIVVGEICISLPRVTKKISSRNSITKKLVGILAHELLHKMSVEDEDISRELEQYFGQNSAISPRTVDLDTEVNSHIREFRKLANKLTEVKKFPSSLKCQMLQGLQQELQSLQPHSSPGINVYKNYVHFDRKNFNRFRRTLYTSIFSSTSCLSDHQLETLIDHKESLQLIKELRKRKTITMNEFNRLNAKGRDKLDLQAMLVSPNYEIVLAQENDDKSLDRAMDVVINDLKVLAKELTKLQQKNNILIYNQTAN